MNQVIAYEIWSSGDVIGVRTLNKTKISTSIADILEFLRYSEGGVLRVFLDLDSSIAPVLRKLPKEVLSRLMDPDDSVSYLGYHLFYIPGKILQIGKSRFYQLKEFYGIPDYAPPTSLEVVQQMADDVMSALEMMGMGDPQKLTSPAAVFEDSNWGKQVYNGIPRGYDVPESCREILNYAAEADRKEWVEAHQIGYWKEGEIWDYDITAAYSFFASRLPDLRDCTFWKSDGTTRRDKSASYGIVKGSFHLYPDSEYSHCSPIMARMDDELLCNPLGNLPEDCYSLEEVRFVENSGIGEFNMVDGWFFGLTGGGIPRLPFDDVMKKAYRMRSWSPMISLIAKGVGNQLVGKLIEERRTGEFGKLHNVVYHALIQSSARVAISRFLIANDVDSNEVVAIQTDGCRLTKYIPIPTNGFGKWRCNGSFPVVVLSPYKIYTESKRPYRVTYDDVMSLIAKHPLSERYGGMVKHRITLGEAIKDEKDITMVGELVDRPAGFDLIALQEEQNRIFPILPSTGQALLNNKYMSNPVILGYV